ncbi:acetyl-CoA C-acyltransferase [Streptomyces sp. NPDC057137]|uniref:acetyl-CoA C-acyltransferase n=1 Tax=Streptomyces sp. NPDC057137 TaxID=3346030 RepID=UPI00362ACB15
MSATVIVAGRRTPIGKLLGGLRTCSAPTLGGIAIAGALDAGGVPANAVDAVLMGTVVQAGVGPNPARQAAARAGIPMTVPASTVNKLCLSGLHAIALADALIRAGQHEVVVAGGMESMTRAPQLIEGSRLGWKYGPVVVSDALDRDALTCAFDGIPMGEATERYQRVYGITRAEQDAYAARSHRLAAAARSDGRLGEEIVPVRTGRADLAHDEGIRPDTSVERLAQLAPAFSDDGTITAASSSQLSDGAAAVVITTAERAAAEDWPVLAEIGAHGTVAGPDPSLVAQPANAIRDALRRDGRLTLDALDLIEINEAFAGVALASTRELDLPAERINVNGGAIALGHPVGMSGARLAITLAHELRRRGGGTGAAALCGGGGQGDALILRVPAH